MRVLVANNHLAVTGGSENFTYALAEELLRRGFSVEYYCDPTKRGIVSERMERELGIGFKSQDSYDLILANHNTMVESLKGCGVIIQTCHGIYPTLEQPSMYADGYVVISSEIQEHFMRHGYESELILNGIDCQRFCVVNALHDSPQRVLSLCQGEEAKNIVREACEELGIEFIYASKCSDNSVVEIEEYINRADIVVGVGRSLYDAMACGRACISLDSRSYSTKFDGHSSGGDGYITIENIDQSIIHNCTGRGALGRHIDKEAMVAEIMKYKRTDGDALREFALRSLNMSVNVDRYLEIYGRIAANPRVVGCGEQLRRCVDTVICSVLGSKFVVFHRLMTPKKNVLSRLWRSIRESFRSCK